MPQRFPRYGWLGIAALGASELLMFARLEPFWTWHTPIAWSSFILVADALVWRQRGDSWLTRSRAEFVFLALCSVPLWLVFEFYNLFISNWYYVNLPENFWLRHAGFAWSFATIWPAIFETGELVAIVRGKGAGLRNTDVGRAQAGVATKLALIIIGALMLIWPFMWPSQYLAAPVWLGFIFLLDPINAWLGGESLLEDLRVGRRERLINLAVSGLVCGLLWEFWNYWARAKWIYTVPILPGAKLFEMPVAGYLGFPAFALECFTMYVTVRLFLWRGRTRPISL